MPSIVICDDSPDYRYYLSVLLRDEWEVVGQAALAREAFDLTVEHQPDVVSMDFRHTGLTPQCIGSFRESTRSRLAVLTGMPPGGLEQDAERYPVDRVLTKDLDADALLWAFRELAGAPLNP